MKRASLSLAVLLSLLAVSTRTQQRKTPKQTLEQSAEAYRLYVAPSSGAVYAHGKWVEVSGKKGSQPAFNSVAVIKCVKSEKLCYDMEAMVTEGRPSIDVTELAVLKWEATEIVASEDSSSICVRHTLTINFRSRAITMVDSPKLPLAESCTGLFGETAKQANTFSLVATEWPDIGDPKTP